MTGFNADVETDDGGDESDCRLAGGRYGAAAGSSAASEGGRGAGASCGPAGMSVAVVRNSSGGASVRGSWSADVVCTCVVRAWKSFIMFSDSCCCRCSSCLLCASSSRRVASK